MNTKRFLTIVIVLCGLAFAGLQYAKKDYDIFVLTWYQPTEDPRPIEWPINFPYWNKTSYPTTGLHELIAIIRAPKIEAIRLVKQNWPEAIDIATYHAPNLTIPDGWAWPDWFINGTLVTQDENTSIQ